MSEKQIHYKRNRVQQLRGFCNTVQLKSISKAAAKMGLTQSAVTLQIQSLERDLGIKLFQGGGQKIQLTKDGARFYAQAIYYVQGIDDLFESFIEHTKNKNGNVINIASNHACISYILPRYIKKFKDFHSNVRFQIRNLSKSESISRLLNDKVDIAIYPMNNGEIPPELEFIPLWKYQPILLLRKDHILAQKETILLSDVAQYELVRIDPDLITLPAFEEILVAHNIRSYIEFENSDWEILKKFVKADIAVAMISNIVLEGEVDGDLVGKSLTEYFPEMTYGLLVKKGKKLRGMVKEFNMILHETHLS